MSRIHRSALLVLMSGLALPAWAQGPCHSARTERLPFFANTDPHFGSVTNVTIYSDSSARGSSGLEAGVRGGAAQWAQACPSDRNPHIPKFNVNWTDNRPSFASPDDQLRRSMLITFKDEPAPQDPATGLYTFAYWGPNSQNVITVYGKCPSGASFPILNCQGNPVPIDWSSSVGQMFLAHEIGHALGLEHDRDKGPDGGSCPMSLMNQAPAGNMIVSPDLCTLADKVNNAEAPCQLAQPSGGAQNPCENTSSLRPGGIGGNVADDFCARYPWTCSGSTPTWSSGSSQCNWFCVSSLGTQWCEWGCTAPAVVPSGVPLPSQDAPDAGPLIHLNYPNEGDTVWGEIEVSGWAHDFVQLTGVAFGVDGVTIPVSGLTTGFSTPEACQAPSGIWWHTYCNPKSGFSGTIDTRRLSNGLHTLQITATGSTGLPSTFERQILTSNTCFDYTPPSVSLVAPSFSVTGSVTLTAGTSDDVGVTSVDFYIDGSYILTDTSAPFTYRWDTSTWTAGSHLVRVMAHDGCGNMASTQSTFTITKDLTAPQTGFISPAPGAIVRGTVNLQAQAIDNVGVTKLEFWVDGALKAVDSAQPFVYAWNTTGDGPHILVANAYDAAGNVGTATLSVMVDNTPPQLSISSPTYNQTITSIVKIAGWATDRTGVMLGFTMDGQSLPLMGEVTWLARQDVCDSTLTRDPRCPNVGWRGYFDTSRFVNGWHTLNIMAVDGAGGTTSTRMNVYVSNTVSSAQAMFMPTGDAMVRELYPSTNFGTGQILGVRYPPTTGDGQYSFLKFSISGLTGAVTSAKLLLRTKTPLIELYVYKVDASWTESSINWLNMPSGSAVELTHRFNLLGETWYDFDVTSYIIGNGYYAFGLSSADTGTNLGCYSRETSFTPVLQVTYHP